MLRHPEAEPKDLRGTTGIEILRFAQDDEDAEPKDDGPQG